MFFLESSACKMGYGKLQVGYLSALNATLSFVKCVKSKGVQFGEHTLAQDIENAEAIYL